MDISKRTGNCVLSISETTELNATTDVDLIVATSIFSILSKREWVARDVDIDRKVAGESIFITLK